MATVDLLVPVCVALATAITTRPVNAKRINEKVTGGRPAILNLRRAGVTGTVAVYGKNVANPWKGNNPVANPSALPSGVSLQENTAVLVGDGSTLVWDNIPITYTAFSNFNWFVEMDRFDRFPMDQSLTTVSSGFVVAAGTTTGTKLTFRTETADGDSATVAFTLAGTTDLLIPTGQVRSPPNRTGAYINLIVKVGGVLKTLTTDYTIDDNAGKIRVTFVSAPTTGTANITFGYAPANGLEIGVIFAGTPDTLLAATGAQIKKEIAGRDRVWAVGASSPSSSDVYIEPGTW